MSTTVQTRPMISMHPSATVQEAAQLMNDCSISCIGLLDADKHFTGILTERDVTAFVARGPDPTTTLVGEIANDFPVVVDGPISDELALERMRSAHIRHLIVHLEDEFRIVSMRDFIVSPVRAGDPEGVTARDLMTSPAL